MTIQGNDSQKPFQIGTYDDYDGPVPDALQRPGILTGQKTIKLDGGQEFLIRVTGSQKNIDTYATTAIFVKLALVPQTQADLDTARSQAREILLGQWKDRIIRLQDHVQIATNEQLEEPDTIWKDLCKQEQIDVRERDTIERDPSALRYIRLLPGPNMPKGLYRIDAIIDPPLDRGNSQDTYATDQMGTLGNSIKVIGGLPVLTLHKFMPGGAPIVISSTNNSVSSFCPNGGELHVEMMDNPPCSYTIDLGIWVQVA